MARNAGCIVRVVLCRLLPLFFLAPAGISAPGDDPTVTAGLLFDALRSGDSIAVDTLVSSEALEVVEDNLSALKDQLRSDPEMTMLRLSSAGYSAVEEEILEWTAVDYLNRTIVLPIMMGRYTPYSMEITGQEIGRNSAVLQVLFSTQTGYGMPSEIRLVRDRGVWLVSSFMGLSSFP
jgi:hypothetical protein